MPGAIPEQSSCRAIEREQLRTTRRALILIELNHNFARPDCQRRGVAIHIFRDSNVLRPRPRSVECERSEIAVCEKYEHAVSVAGHRGTGKTRRVFDFEVCQAAGHVFDSLPPKNFASRCVKAEHFALLGIAAGDEHAISPNHRRVQAGGGRSRFPDDVRGWLVEVPFAVGLRTAAI